jgi:hypothetical protein
MLRAAGASAIAAIFLGAVSTAGDLVWRLWIPRHRAVFGLVHGAVICLCLGMAVGARSGRLAAGALAGPVIGLAAAGGFYLLAPMAGMAAMFPMWMVFWILFGLLDGRLRGERRLAPVLVRGLLAAILSGAAFYAISGIWTRPPRGGPNYTYNLAAWTFAFFPGFLALFAGRRAQA